MNREDDLIIISQKYIKMVIKCPKCDKFYNANITKIKGKCEKCNEEFEKDISIEDKGEYDTETLKIAGWIALKTLGQKGDTKARIQVHDGYMNKAEYLIGLLKNLGIIVADRKNIRKTINGRMIEVYEFTLKKSEYLRYYVDKD